MNHLLIVDPQNDFCDLPASHLPAPREGAPAPALPVSGAHADMQRVAQFIDRVGSALHHITVTLDSHQHFDIGHPCFWVREDGSVPPAFTEVSAEDVRRGRYRPRKLELRERVLTYLESLQEQGRYRHMIWPTHCEIGSWGHNVHEDVRRAYNRWEEATARTVVKVLKGKNPHTEHYSAVRAEVPDPDDPETLDNRALLEALRVSDAVYIAGEASSHCVKATTEHIADAFSANERRRLVLLTDCMSPVAGFEAQHDGFLRAMQKLGLGLSTSVEASARFTGQSAAGGDRAETGKGAPS